MNAPIVAIATEKGGVGKTTITIHLAQFLTTHSRPTLIVDADPQATATSWTCDAQPQPGALLQIVVAHTDPRRLIQHTKTADILPSNTQDTTDLTNFLASSNKPLDTIRRALEPVRKLYRYILIDCMPSRSRAFEHLLATADWIAMPTQLERGSLEAIQRMADIITTLHDEWSRPTLLAIIPNQIRISTTLHRRNLTALRDTMPKVLWPTVPYSIRVPEAHDYGQTMFDYKPNDKTTQAYTDLAQRLILNLEDNHD